jgi:hypothetical protein
MPRIRSSLTRIFPACALLGGTAAVAEPESQTGRIDFGRDVQPLLAQHCYHCHGPDTAKGGLRFDRRGSVFPGGDAVGALLVPGDPEKSEFFDRLVTHDAKARMPAESDPLSPHEVDVLRRWIAQGAEWPEDARHWAYVQPARPPLPQLADTVWPRNPIDAFVLARLEAEKMRPAPEADRHTLIRRLYLDLIGLPPPLEAVDRFVQDTASDAYERLVQELLDSPHYGERWAIRWLDLARYGDTDGYDGDKPREMWPYRDWVIQALNQDLPFDQFAIAQIAGDLLPDAGPEQQLATAFIRNSAVPQYRFDMLADRVSTLGTVFLGLTLECAQCHNHKFDPVSQHEFYQLYALFENAEDRQLKLTSPLTGGTAEVLVAGARGKLTPAKLDVEGSPFRSEEPIFPQLPAAFHQPPQPPVEWATRLDLARWITDPANPLLARVVVNRHWETLFGAGLVRTSEDLGLRTESPSHPELLDWLALEFIESGWRMKHLHRLIVSSATYRQSARVPAEVRQRDPDNRLLARGARFRVEAELVRDITLSAAGLLHPALGGPPVFPPQPHGVSENRFKGAYRWLESKGTDRHRRGIYTFWKRAALHPSLALFDAPRRETTCASRTPSNTALQALVTLNDPAFVEAAIHLGLRMAEAATNSAGRLEHGIRRCLARAPQAGELDALLDLFQAEHTRFQNDPAAAKAFLASAKNATAPDGCDPAEWAALSIVAGVLLNLDETITRP